MCVLKAFGTEAVTLITLFSTQDSERNSILCPDGFINFSLSWRELSGSWLFMDPQSLFSSPEQEQDLCLQPPGMRNPLRFQLISHQRSLQAEAALLAGIKGTHT